MNEITCRCKRIIPRESHTGLCQLNYFISYTGNGEHDFDAVELRRIVGVVVSEAAEQNGHITQQLKQAIALLHRWQGPERQDSHEAQVRLEVESNELMKSVAQRACV